MRFQLFLFLMVLMTKAGFAQNKELAIWTAASSSFELSYRINVDGALAFRSNAGLNAISRYFGEAGLGYKLSKSFSVIFNLLITCHLNQLIQFFTLITL